jgi:hypothetical protein
MKISGPGSGPLPEAAGAVPDAKGASGKGFAQAVDKGAEPEAAKGAAAPGIEAAHGAAAPGIDAAAIVADISSELRAGRITPQAAVERVIERILDRQLGADAPATIREQVGSALREALESDPLVGEKVRALSASSG